MSLTIGARLGPYEVVGLLGEGGMGQVYRAHDTKLGRDVALKVLPDAFTTDAGRVARFEREARTLAALNHTNIAQIYGFETWDSVHALVMELVEGRTLADLVATGSPEAERVGVRARDVEGSVTEALGVGPRRHEKKPTPLPIADTLAIARQIALALEVAHDRGIIHRDLKPANVLVRDDGSVKVLDFGLAKAVGPETDESGSHGGANASQSPTLTTPAATAIGMILGTAAYMSPEQARGRTADRRSDIWAFGCVLYEMLTGRRLFDGEDVSDTLALVLRGDLTLAELPPDTPPIVRRLLQRCLERDRSKRLDSAAAARLDLEEAAAAPAVVTAPVAPVAPARWRTALPWAIAAFAVASTATVIWRTTSSDAVAPSSVIRFSVPPPPGESIQSGLMGDAAKISPDGRYVASRHIRPGGGPARLALIDLRAGSTRDLGGFRAASGFAWAPDSRRLAFVSLGHLRTIDVETGVIQSVVETTTEPAGTAWSGSNSILYTVGGAGIFSVPADGSGPPVQVTTVDSARGESGHRFPSSLPDGRRFLYLSVSALSASIAVASLDDPATTTVIPAADSGAVYGSGHLLFLRQGNLMAQPFDPDRLASTGQPVVVAQDVMTSGIFGGDFSVSASGVLVYKSTVGQQTSVLTWVDPGGRVVGTVGGRADQTSLTLSPDGSSVLASVLEPRARSRDLWQYLVRGGQQKLTIAEGDDWAAVWSPDGTRVAYSASRKGILDLYVRAADGTGDERLLYESADNKYVTDWSRDSRLLLYYTGNARSVTLNDIWVLSLDGTPTPRPVVQTPASETNAVFSPDGRWIAFASNETGLPQIYVSPFPGPGRKEPVSTEGGQYPRWSHNGRDLYWLQGGTRLMAAAVDGRGDTLMVGAIRPVFDQPRLVTETFGGYGVGRVFDVAKDGRFLMALLPEQTVPRPINVVVNWPAAVSR